MGEKFPVSRRAKIDCVLPHFLVAGDAGAYCDSTTIVAVNQRPLRANDCVFSTLKRPIFRQAAHDDWHFEPTIMSIASNFVAFGVAIRRRRRQRAIRIGSGQPFPVWNGPTCFRGYRYSPIIGSDATGVDRGGTDAAVTPPGMACHCWAIWNGRRRVRTAPIWVIRMTERPWW